MLFLLCFLSSVTSVLLPFDVHSTSLCDISILRSDHEGINMDIVLNGIEMVDNNGAYTITIPDWGTNAQLGEPDLPSYATLLAVPGEDLAEVEVEFSNPVQYSIRVAPVTDDSNNGYSNNSSAISSTCITGVEANATLGEYGYWRSQAVARLSVTPFDYDQHTQILTVYQDISVKVEFSAPIPPCPIVRNNTREMYSNTLLNYEFLEEEILFDRGPGGDDINYFVYYPVEYPEVLDAIQPLVDHIDGRHPNWNITLRPVECEQGPGPIYANINPEQLKSMILADYVAHYPEYILLVGDHPCPNAYPGAYYQKFGLPMETIGNIMSDTYYACLTGSAWYPEVAIGRIPGKPTWITQLVNKIIYYDTFFSPGNRIEPERVYDNPNRILLLSDTSEPAFRIVCEGIASEDYDTNLNFYHFEADELSGPDMLYQISRGNGVVLYLGHGLRDSWEWNNSFDSTNDITNTYNRMPSIALNIDCYNGRIAHWPRVNESICDAWIRGGIDQGGACGTLGATTASRLTSNYKLAYRIFDLLYGGSGFTPIQQIGLAINNAHIYAMTCDPTYGVKNFKMYAWYGDPSQFIWTAENMNQHFNVQIPLSLDQATEAVTELHLRTDQQDDFIAVSVIENGSSTVSYSVFDLSGRCMENILTSDLAVFSLRDFPNGVYALHASLNEMSVSSTFVVLK